MQLPASPTPPPTPLTRGKPVRVVTLQGERKRYAREYWVHLLLFAFAVSIVVHIMMMLSLWWYREPAVEARYSEPVEFNLAEAQEPVQPTEDVELPDPSPLAAGEIMTRMRFLR